MTKLQELTKAIHEAVPDIRGLGRDITLADVLFAVEKWYWFDKSGIEKPMANEAGADWYFLKIIKRWNPKQNALHLQSKETIDFLYEIICNT